MLFYLTVDKCESHCSHGDELLLVTDGEVGVEVLEDLGDSWTEQLAEGCLFVVPKGKWHRLTATDNVTILFVSPSEGGVERKREHPIHGSDA